MTEAEWLIAKEPYYMVHALPKNASSRKLRLFAVACCRRIWKAFTDERSRRCVEVAEQFAEGVVSRKVMGEARQAALDAERDAKTLWAAESHPDSGASYVGVTAAGAAESVGFFRPIVAAASMQSACEAAGAGSRSNTKRRQKHAAAMANLLRCIIGNPFRPVKLAKSWLAWNNGAAGQLAQTIYDGRQFDRLPDLADVLEEAGCTNSDILSHCRVRGEHARGCWVLDLVLGRK